MKCHQCERPAIYKYDGIGGLCLACAKTHDEIMFRQFLLNAAAANQALDDMDAISGIATGGGRYPIAALAAAAMRNQVTTNSISISGSSVGVVSTGDLAKIDAIITITEGSDAEELGRALKQLTEGVLAANELAADAKKEIVELISSLSEQVTGRRSKSVMGSILKGIDERVKSINAIWSLYDRVAQLIQGM
jgi:hypothetical protein